MLPIYSPLVDPTPPDPADLTDFQNWTAANLPDIESSMDAARNDLVDTWAGIAAAEVVMDAMGTDLASAFDTLSSYAAEEDADTFADELAAAAAGDAALADMLNNLGTSNQIPIGPGGPTFGAQIRPAIIISGQAPTAPGGETAPPNAPSLTPA
jgi:hypothetical protein